MKILVLGLHGATPEVLLGDERLTNFRRLMELGCYGRLESNFPLTAEQAWLCLAIGQDRGSLGVSISREHADLSARDSLPPISGAYRGITIWDHIIRQGKRAIITGWLPFEPSEEEGLIIHRFDDELIDAEHLRTTDKAWLKDQIYSISRKQFEKVQHLLQTEAWDYFQFSETGLGQLQHAFWQHHDTEHSLLAPENTDQVVVRDYWRYLDAQLGSILETLTGDAMVLVISVQGAQSEEHELQDTSLNSIQPGFFILAAPNTPLSGEMEAIRFIDIPPTLLELGGYDIPDSMQGKSLFAGMAYEVSPETGLTAEEEEILRERLSGLGYIS